jgi:hypothetical protein
MSDQKPSIGRVVHYVSHGTPPRSDGSQAYTSVCRAAIVTEVGENDIVGLAMFGDTGILFKPLSDGGVHHQENEQAGGSWHWPGRVELGGCG